MKDNEVLNGIETGLSYDDVLLVPQRSPVDSRSDVSVATKLTLSVELGNPLVSAAMDTVTEAQLACALAETGGIGVIHRFLSREKQAEEVRFVKERGYQVAGAVGLDEDYMARADALCTAGVDAVVFDVAHGHLDRAVEAIESLRSFDVPIVAGNVATPSGVVDLASAGADAVKVGVGPGAFCTTRKVSGAGVPQLTAVDTCAAAAPDDVCIIADGGIKTSGDAVKALMAGADTVMMGSFFAETEEAAGSKVSNGELVNEARGMASREANNGREDKEICGDDVVVAEGVSGSVSVDGSVSEKVHEFVGGIKSGLSYCGGHSISEAQENAEFIRVTNSTVHRNGSHFK